MAEIEEERYRNESGVMRVLTERRSESCRFGSWGKRERSFSPRSMWWVCIFEEIDSRDGKSLIKSVLKNCAWRGTVWQRGKIKQENFREIFSFFFKREREVVYIEIYCRWGKNEIGQRQLVYNLVVTSRLVFIRGKSEIRISFGLFSNNYLPEEVSFGLVKKPNRPCKMERR